MSQVKRLIHIATDEKFVNNAMAQFNAIHDQNQFYIVVRNDDVQLDYVNLPENAKKITRNALMELSCAFHHDTDVVIFHSLPSIFFPFL